MALGKWLDWSQARPALGKVKANGYGGVYRYVCSDASERGLPGKRLTTSERDAILAAGLDIGIHGEDDSGAAKLGYTRGKQQGQQWADYASTVLAAPKGMTIVAAIDYDTAGTYPNVVADYLHGVADGFQGEYTVGVYGSIWVVDGALTAGHATHGVQTIAWSSRQVSTLAHLYQGGQQSEFPGTDYNAVLRVPHGTWLQTLNGADVPLTDDDVNRLATAAHDQFVAIMRGPEFKAIVAQQVSAVLHDTTHPHSLDAIDANIDNTDTQLKAALQAAETDIENAVQGIVAAGGDPQAVAKAVTGLLAAKLGAP